MLERLRDDRGRLLKRWREGHAGLPGVLDDHAFMTWGLTRLYEATFEPRWLEEALSLADVMLHDFRDDEDGALFLTARDGERLPVRVKESHDGALPSGNSVAALALITLARLTGRTALEDAAARILAAFSGHLARMPSAHCVMLAALDLALGPSREIVLTGPRDAANAEAMLSAVREAHAPRTVVLWRDAATAAALDELAPFTRSMGSGDVVRAHACTGFACASPTDDPRALAEILARE